MQKGWCSVLPNPLQAKLDSGALSLPVQEQVNMEHSDVLPSEVTPLRTIVLCMYSDIYCPLFAQLGPKTADCFRLGCEGITATKSPVSFHCRVGVQTEGPEILI